MSKVSKSFKGSRTSGFWTQGSEGHRVQDMWEHFLVYPQGKKGLKGQYFQDSQGFKGSMFQWYRRSKGFRVSRDRGFPLTDKGFRWDWRFQNPRVSGKYINMSSIKISSSVHSVPLCSLSIRWSINGQWEIYLILETGPMGERTPREGIRVSK